MDNALGYDPIEAAFSKGALGCFRHGQESPRDLVSAYIDVKMTRVGGDFQLYIVKDVRSKKYSLIWTRGDYVCSFDESRSYPMPAYKIPGVVHCCKGQWISKTAMLVKIREIFDRCDSRGLFIP